MAGIDPYSAVAGIGLDIAGTFLQDRLNTRAAREQRSWEENMFKTRYQMQTADLKAAGLNPMLAYMQSPGGAPSGASSSVQKPGLADSFNASRAVTAQVANTNADTVKKVAEKQNVDMDTALKGGMIESVAAQAVHSMSSAAQADAMVQQIRATLPKIDTEIQKMQTEIQKDKSNIDLNNAMIRAQQFKNSLVQAETMLTGKKATSEQQDITLKQPRVSAYEKHPESAERVGKVGAFADLMQQFWRTVNPFSSQK